MNAPYSRLYERVLHDMSDGVMAVSQLGHVVAFNPSAARILGIAADEVVAQPLFNLVSSDDRADALIDTVMQAIGSPDGAVDTVVPYGAGPEGRRLRVTTSRLRDQDGGAVVVFQDITEVEALRQREQQLAADLKAQHRELQEAFVALDRKAKELEETGRRLQLIRLGATALVVLLFAGIGLLNFGENLTERLASATQRREPTKQQDRPLYEVRPTPVRDAVSMTGTLAPGTVFSVVAPFSGRVDVKLFEYGVPVTEGTVLLSLVSPELETQLANARAAFIKAQRSYEDIEDWDASADVDESRRRLEQARLSLQDAQSKLEDSRRLFERGIVARQEVESQERQVRSQQDAVTSAEAALDRTLARGDERNREIARLELDNARRALADLERQAAEAVVTAPASGVPFAPPAKGDDQTIEIAVGSRLESGATVLSIGDVGRFAVEGKIDEVDVARVAAGQQAVIRGPAFAGRELRGYVEAVQAQASIDGSSRSALAGFKVRVVIPTIPDALRHVVRIGMSASLEIVVYENPEALVVPTEAVQGAGSRASVQVWREETGAAETVAVTLGPSTPGGIEITAGLAPGDRVLLR